MGAKPLILLTLQHNRSDSDHIKLRQN